MAVAMKKGFTLIEVCLVMVVFGIAVSSLMALFPVSLRQGNMAVSDSVVTTFADNVMNTLAANAAEMPNWNDWKLKNNFSRKVAEGIEAEGLSVTRRQDDDGYYYYEGEADDYLGVKKSYIHFRLKFHQVTTPEDYGGRLYRATLRVTDVRSASWTSAAVFVTYLAYMGEVP